MTSVDLFNLLDIDRSGDVSSVEITDGFSKIGFVYDSKKVNSFILKFDADSNGVLSADEFTALNDAINSARVTCAVEELFSEMDSDGDGVLSLTELQMVWARLSEGKPDEKQVQSFLDLVDENQDGVVSKDEFVTNAVVRIAMAINTSK